MPTPRATEIARTAVERHVGLRLTRPVSDPAAQLRGEVMLAIIAGTLLMRRVVVMQALDDAEPAQLQALLEAALAAVAETALPCAARFSSGQAKHLGRQRQEALRDRGSQLRTDEFSPKRNQLPTCAR